MNKPITLQEKVNLWRGVSNVTKQSEPSVPAPADAKANATGDTKQSTANTNTDGPSKVVTGPSNTKSAQPISKKS